MKDLEYKLWMGRRTFLKFLGLSFLGLYFPYTPNTCSKKDSAITATTDPVTGRTLFSKDSYTGMKINVIPIPREMAHAHLSVKFGSCHTLFKDNGKEAKIPDGTAHFLEHLVFQREDVDLGTAFKRTGALSNAYTAKDYTNYHINFAKNIEKNLADLLYSVLNLEFTDEQMAKERTVILEEKRRSDDNVGYIIFENLSASLFFTPYNNSGLGSEEEISRAITPEIIRYVHGLFYRPSNMFLTIVGNYDAEHIINLVENSLKNLNVKRSDAVSVEDYDEPIYPKEKSKVIEVPNVQSPYFVMAFKHVPKNNAVETFKETIMLELIAEMMFGPSSNLANSDLVLDFDASYYDLKGRGYTIIYAVTPEPEKLEKMIMGEIEDFKKKQLNLNDFERILQVNIGKSAREYDNADSLINAFIHYYIKESNFFDRLGYVIGDKDKMPELSSLLKEHYDHSKFCKVTVLPKN